jgi:RNA polymerase sigma-70 factor, ECF subfamily
MTIQRSENNSLLRDEDLMIAIHRGDTGAFNEIYSRYHKRLLYYFYRMLGNSNEKACDFLQDIFMKIIERPDLFDPSRRFCTWLFSVAHNMCKNEYRRVNIRKMVEWDENLEQYAGETEMWDEEKQLTADQIFKEISELGETEKTAFLLYYREDFSLREIGQVLNLPEGTVKSKLFYTRKKISKNLQMEEKKQGYEKNKIPDQKYVQGLGGEAQR